MKKHVDRNVPLRRPSMRVIWRGRMGPSGRGLLRPQDDRSCLWRGGFTVFVRNSQIRVPSNMQHTTYILYVYVSFHLNKKIHYIKYI